MPHSRNKKCNSSTHFSSKIIIVIISYSTFKIHLKYIFVCNLEANLFEHHTCQLTWITLGESSLVWTEISQSVTLAPGEGNRHHYWQIILNNRDCWINPLAKTANAIISRLSIFKTLPKGATEPLMEGWLSLYPSSYDNIYFLFNIDTCYVHLIKTLVTSNFSMFSLIGGGQLWVPMFFAVRSLFLTYMKWYYYILSLSTLSLSCLLPCL